MKAFLSLCLIFVFSCSNLEKNMVKNGDLIIKGGVFQSQEWNDNLKFTRYSWYKELTLVFDLLLTKLDHKTPFYAWLSNSEKEALAQCRESMVVVTYVWDPDKINRGMFFEQTERLGYERLSLPNFKRHLKMHPNYEALSLQLYNIEALCKKQSSTEQFAIRFPGYKETFISDL